MGRCHMQSQISVGQAQYFLDTEWGHLCRIVVRGCSQPYLEMPEIEAFCKQYMYPAAHQWQRFSTSGTLTTGGT